MEPERAPEPPWRALLESRSLPKEPLGHSPEPNQAQATSSRPPASLHRLRVFLTLEADSDRLLGLATAVATGATARAHRADLAWTVLATGEALQQRLTVGPLETGGVTLGDADNPVLAIRDDGGRVLQSFAGITVEDVAAACRRLSVGGVGNPSPDSVPGEVSA